jgi:hypothetical protein
VTHCRPASRRAQTNGVHLTVCAVRVFGRPQRAFPPRSSSHHGGPVSVADPQRFPPPGRRFFRGTLAPKCETSRAFAAVSAQVFAFENRDLASQLASYNFLCNPLKTRKPPKWRLFKYLIWRGRRGSNPRPPA